jgi:hypothetical protein
VNKFSTWLTGLLLILFCSMTALAFQYPLGARMAPLVIGVPGIVLCLVQLGLDAIAASGGRFANIQLRPAPKLGKPDYAPDGKPEFGSEMTSRRELAMWCYFLAFIAGILVLGFYAVVPVVLVAYLHFEAGVIWPRALAAGVIGTAILYLTVERFLGFDLFPGFIMRLAMRLSGL